MEDNFTLCQGVSVGGAEKLRSCCHIQGDNIRGRSEEHTSELQSHA